MAILQLTAGILFLSETLSRITGGETPLATFTAMSAVPSS